MLGSADGDLYFSGRYTLATQPVESLPQFAWHAMVRRELQLAWFLNFPLKFKDPRRMRTTP